VSELLLRPTLPTDRSEDAPDIGVGVDTVAVKGPASMAFLEALQHQYYEQTVDYETGELIEVRSRSSASIRVGLARCWVSGERHGSDVTARLEFSAPTMLRGHNRDALPTNYLIDVVDAAVTDLGRHLPGLPALELLEVQRLDLARDFHGVASPTNVLAALSSVPIRYARLHREFKRPDGSLQTLTRGSRSEWTVTGYDKSYELAERATLTRDASLEHVYQSWADASAGQLRFELRLQRRLLRRKGIGTLNDAVAQSDYLARHYFRAAGWETDFGGIEHLAALLRSLRAEVTPAETRNVIVLLACRLWGVTPPLSRHSCERSLALARRFNLFSGSPGGDSWRLDFDSGQQVYGPR